MKTLHLNLKRKWFDMIKSGEKKEEYRTQSNYWTTRLIDHVTYPNGNPTAVWKDYKTITFSNGYAKNADRFEIELLGIYSHEGRPEWHP